MNIPLSSSDREIRPLLAHSATCALYLTDALESKRSSTVAEALRDICRARGTGKAVLEVDGNLRVSDLLDAVSSSGLRLVAFPVR